MGRYCCEICIRHHGEAMERGPEGQCRCRRMTERPVFGGRTRVWWRLGAGTAVDGMRAVFVISLSFGAAPRPVARPTFQSTGFRVARPGAYPPQNPGRTARAQNSPRHRSLDDPGAARGARRHAHRPPQGRAHRPAGHRHASSGAGPGDVGTRPRATLQLQLRAAAARVHDLFTGRYWDCQFEWASHEAEARKAGLSDAAIETLRAGGTRFDAGDEQTIHDYGP